MTSLEQVPLLKRAIAVQEPILETLFTDAELAGMIEEAGEWCAPGCKCTGHITHAVRIARRVAFEVGPLAN